MTRPSVERIEVLRVLDLFSGIGGFSLGLERTGGFRTVAFCEIEPYPRAILAKHWPGIPCYEDVRTVTADRLAADGIGVDVICGGFPCQDISLAGDGAGLAGERSGLWREYARLVGELRPRYALVENVAALTFRGLLGVLGDLAEIGFDAEWSVLSACRVGAPHTRERLFIVAYPNMDGLETSGTKGNGDDAAALRRRIDPGYIQEATVAIGSEGRSPFASEPSMARVADGVPNRVDRNHALGNSVIPQITELIGRAIMKDAQ